MRKLASAAVLLVAVSAFGQIAEGDRAWSNRAEGSQNGRAQAGPINAAIAAYEKAVAANPNDIEARWKLLRAYRFKGAYVASTNDEKKAIYSTAKKAGEEALKLINGMMKTDGKTSEKQVAEKARAVKGAAEVFLWDSINWGEWALAYGKLAAAREGAADRIRREAGIANLIDPKLEGGSPSRVLGRLHDQTPRIPFITGWASQKEAVRFLNESLKHDPQNKITMVFLAEAMVSDKSETKPQAIQMLKNAVSTPVDPEFVVEQTAALVDAKALLKKWGA